MKSVRTKQLYFWVKLLLSLGFLIFEYFYTIYNNDLFRFSRRSRDARAQKQSKVPPDGGI